MAPPPSDDGIEWELRSIAEGLLPPNLQELQINRLELLLKSIAAIDEPEARTDANIQKFSYFLQKYAGLKEFSPSGIHLGGIWDELRWQERRKLTRNGFLRQRPSRMSGVDAPTFEIHQDYREKIHVPELFKTKFQEYKEVHNNNLRSPFRSHDRNVVSEWISNPSNYLGFDRERYEQIRHGDGLDVSSDIIPVSDSQIGSDVKSMNQVYRPFARILDFMIRNYKYIYSEDAQQEEPERYERSLRMFDQRKAERQFRKNPSKVVGDPVLYIGIPGASSMASPDNFFRLWKNPRFEQNILVEFDKYQNIDQEDLLEYSIGVLGILDRSGQNVVVKGLAVLKQDNLSPQLIDYLRNRALYGEAYNHQQRIQRAIVQIDEEIKSIHGEDRKYPRKLMKRLNQATTITIAIDYVKQFKQEHPELAWIADKAMEILNP